VYLGFALYFIFIQPFGWGGYYLIYFYPAIRLAGGLLFDTKVSILDFKDKYSEVFYRKV
jgi:hypothetical protein